MRSSGKSKSKWSRRQIGEAGALAAAATLIPQPGRGAERNLRLRDLELVAIRATERTTWLIVQLHTNSDLVGLGECSLGPTRELPQLEQAFGWAKDLSPFEVQRYRQRGLPEVSAGDVFLATAFSSVEQAMWDLVGKALDAPVYDLAGGRIPDDLEAYANINRATVDRSPAGFARSAAAARSDGFRAVKAAPFDGYPKEGTQEEIDRHVERGIEATFAIREAVGDEVALLIDCHSFFDLEQSIEVARRLEGARLEWYEEPVAPTDAETTRRIREAIDQRLAGGEFLFGMTGFQPLIEQHAVDVIMPDVKHCGGFEEGRRIAAHAELHGVEVSPHNPSGPIATAASAHLCAGFPNLRRIEYQWGEVDWRPQLLDPAERFENGRIRLPSGPGWGVALNPERATKHRI